MTEVQREDLVGQYIGLTDKIVKDKISEASTGVMFLDEAYRLNPDESCSKDYGKQAIEGIMQHLDKIEAPVFIFAGYQDKMKRFMDTNAGLRRRISTVMHMQDYNDEELAKITRLKLDMKKIGFQPNLNLSDLFSGICSDTKSQFNGALGQKLITESLYSQEKLLMQIGGLDKQSIKFLSNEDFLSGAKRLQEKLRKVTTTKKTFVSIAVQTACQCKCFCICNIDSEDCNNDN